MDWLFAALSDNAVSVSYNKESNTSSISKAIVTRVDVIQYNTV